MGKIKKQKKTRKRCFRISLFGHFTHPYSFRTNGSVGAEDVELKKTLVDENGTNGHLESTIVIDEDNKIP
jgi:hypothetical protein